VLISLPIPLIVPHPEEIIEITTQKNIKKYALNFLILLLLSKKFIKKLKRKRIIHATSYHVNLYIFSSIIFEELCYAHESDAPPKPGFPGDAKIPPAREFSLIAALRSSFRPGRA